MAVRDKHRIAPTKRLGPSKKDVRRQNAAKIQHSTPLPGGLPAGLPGRIEHMRGHARWYYAEAGPKSPQGDFLWRAADALARGPVTPVNGQHRS